MNEDKINFEDWMKLYWKHFELHSNQRMSLVKFYLSIISALGGGYFTLVIHPERSIWAEIVLLLFIAFLSIIFALLDQRTAMLIKDAENAIRELEEKFNAPKLFTASEKADKTRAYGSYSDCIQLAETVIIIVCVFALIGYFFR